MSILEDAITFAANAHEGQIRKLSGTPYILHPLEVASIISTMTTDLETMAAGVLHDTVEDCGVALSELRERFGARVCALVESETERRSDGRADAETWQERKTTSLDDLRRTQDRDVKILWLADKLSNVRSFYREYEKDGDRIWLSLHQKDPRMQAWYYRTIADCLSELSDTSAYAEYIRLVSELFAGVPAAQP